MSISSVLNLKKKIIPGFLLSGSIMNIKKYTQTSVILILNNEWPYFHADTRVIC